MASFKRELGWIVHYSIPLVLAQIGWKAMGLVDLAMVQDLGRRATGAVLIGDMWAMGSYIFAMGVLLGIDPIVSQAHGRGDAVACGRGLQRGLVLSAVLSLPLCIAWYFTEEVLLGFGQPPEVARESGAYVRSQVFGAPFLLAFTALRQYLQARGLMRPALYIVYLANFVNVALNWLLIDGNLGFPALGVVGSAIATGSVRVFLLIVLGFVVWRWRLLEGAWTPWSRAVLHPASYRQILAYGLPTGIMLGLEIWGFVAAGLLASMLGDVERAAHACVMSCCSMSFMVPLGISMATVARVGHLIGGGRPEEAQKSAWVSVGLGGAAMLVFAAVFTLLRWQLPRAFTDDAEVLALAALVLPIAGAFQFFDGTQAVGGAVLRAMGKPLPAAIINLFAYYVLALPIGWGLAFRSGLGLAGIWWSLLGALAIVAAFLAWYIATRGPRHQGRIASEGEAAEDTLSRRAEPGVRPSEAPRSPPRRSR